MFSVSTLYTMKCMTNKFQQEKKKKKKTVTKEEKRNTTIIKAVTRDAWMDKALDYVIRNFRKSFL